MANRETKKLGKQIREETGVPLAACCIIARHILNWELWALEDLDSTKKWCRTVYSGGGCSCCDGTTELIVEGPKGTYRRY